MKGSGPERSRGISRRDLLKRAGVLGVASTVPAGLLAREAEPSAAPQVVEREALEVLTSREADTVDAIVARLIPTDERGPGALEARVGHFIDRAIADLRSHPRFAQDVETYPANLAAVDAYAQSVHGAPFPSLNAEQQDAILTTMEANRAPGFSPDSRTFFNLIRGHAIQGMFGDPYYGGNADAIGWKLIGFPGIKLDVPASDQALNTVPRPGRKSTYDFAFFKRSPRGG